MQSVTNNGNGTYYFYGGKYKYFRNPTSSGCWTAAQREYTHRLAAQNSVGDVRNSRALNRSFFECPQYMGSARPDRTVITKPPLRPWCIRDSSGCARIRRRQMLGANSDPGPLIAIIARSNVGVHSRHHHETDSIATRPVGGGCRACRNRVEVLRAR